MQDDTTNPNGAKEKAVAGPFMGEETCHSGGLGATGGTKLNEAESEKENSENTISSSLRLFGYGKAEETLVERPVDFDRSS